MNEMKAMVLERTVQLKEDSQPLVLRRRPVPEPGPDQVLIEVSACGVCHTELDEIEGRAAPPSLPVIPGHQVVGTVADHGAGVTSLKRGDRVGVAWIYSACGRCDLCRAGLENLCRDFKATGLDADGGYAGYMAVDARFAYPIPESLTDSQAAPLLCAGAIGLRSLRLTGLRDGQRLGMTGFGASAHLVLKLARSRFPHSDIYVFARSEK
ncbi:MAG: alcohol dehydrogenase catalytic domain-containing protein, partial [Desulfosarcinaceae bacterium]